MRLSAITGMLSAFDRNTVRNQSESLSAFTGIRTLSLLVSLRALEDAAQEAEHLHGELRKAVPRVHAKLRAMKAAGGVVSVSTVHERGNDKDDARAVGPRGFGKADSVYDSAEEVLGYLPDTTVLLTKFEPTKELEALLRQLMKLPQSLSSEEAFLWACDASEDLQRLERAVSVLRECAGGYMRLAARLDRFAEFFSPSLFEVLDSWGRHEANAFRLKASAASGAFRLEHAERWNDRERVVLRPDMGKLTRRGRLPGFE